MQELKLTFCPLKLRSFSIQYPWQLLLLLACCSMLLYLLLHAANANGNSFRKSYESIRRTVTRPPLDVLILLSYVNMVFLFNAVRKSHQFNAASLFQFTNYNRHFLSSWVPQQQTTSDNIVVGGKQNCIDGVVSDFSKI